MRRVHDETDARGSSRPGPAKVAPSAEAGSSNSAAAPIEAMVESLQRTAGNAAVGQMLAKRAQKSDRTDGQPLPPSFQAAGERRLKSDLSGVRVHTDASAERYTESLSAEAVTVGPDVFLSPRAGGLETSRGRKTLMHELVHTAQMDGQVDAPVAAVSNPGGAAEREASSIAAGGFGGPLAQPTQVAPVGIAHRKIADKEEEAPAKEANLDFLGPLAAEEGGPKPGESGQGESIAYEITVMQPLREAMTAIEQQEWEAALAVLQDVGMRLLDYQVAYEERDPMIFTQLMSARGWLGILYGQLNRRMGQGSWTDDQMTDHMRDYVAEFERIQSKL